MFPRDLVNVQSGRFIQFCGPSWVGQRSEKRVHSVLWLLRIQSTFRTAGFIQVWGPSWIGQRSEESVHSILWFLWIQSTFKATGVIQFCGPSWAGVRFCFGLLVIPFIVSIDRIDLASCCGADAQVVLQSTLFWMQDDESDLESDSVQKHVFIQSCGF